MNTDHWNERYHNEYEFVKGVAPQLLEKGQKERLFVVRNAVKNHILNQ